MEWRKGGTKRGDSPFHAWDVRQERMKVRGEGRSLTRSKRGGIVIEWEMMGEEGEGIVVPVTSSLTLPCGLQVTQSMSKMPALIGKWQNPYPSDKDT